MAYYHAKDLGVSVGGAVCGAQSFTVSSNTPDAPIFQLGSLEACGIMQHPQRWTASVTVSGGNLALLSGTWISIIEVNDRTVSCPLFGISGAVCTGVTFSGRAGSQPTATWNFAGTSFAAGGASVAGTCGCDVKAEDISGPTAAFNVSASCSVAFLEEYGNDEYVQVVASNPVVRGTFENYEGVSGATSVSVGGTSIVLSETVELGGGGRGSVGGFATASMSYIAGNNGDPSGGLTIG